WLEVKSDAVGLTPANLAAQHHVSVEAAGLVLQLPHLRTGLRMLESYWPLVVSTFREQACPVRCISTSVVVHYEDGTVAHMGRITRAGLGASAEIGDGDAVVQVQQ